MASPIHLDTSSTGIVVHCTECPYWRAFRFHKIDAWAAAVAHEELVHPERREQRNAADKRRERARHAE